MTSCAKHRQDPVQGYRECPGCEVEALQAEARELMAELARVDQLYLIIRDALGLSRDDRKTKVVSTIRTLRSELQDLHQINDNQHATVLDLSAELERTRADLSAWRELHAVIIGGFMSANKLWPNEWPQDVAAAAFAIYQLHQLASCGCGHPACRNCGRDRDVEAALSQPAAPEVAHG